MRGKNLAQASHLRFKLRRRVTNWPQAEMPAEKPRGSVANKTISHLCPDANLSRSKPPNKLQRITNTRRSRLGAPAAIQPSLRDFCFCPPYPQLNLRAILKCSCGTKVFPTGTD